MRGESEQRESACLVEQFGALEGQLPDPCGPQKILVWRGPGAIQASLAIELVIASALAQRGADVEFVLCDGLLSGCLLRSVDQGTWVEDWAKRCRDCYGAGRSLVRAVGLPYRGMRDWVSRSRRDQFHALASAVDLAAIPSWQHQNAPVGQYALSATIRYLKGKQPAKVEGYDRILRAYFYSGLVSAEASQGAIAEIGPDRVFMQHGIYVDWGPAFALALNRGIPVTRWMRGYLKNSLYLRTSVQDDARHMYYLHGEDWEARSSDRLSTREEAQLDRYLQKRASGGGSRQQLFDEDPSDVETLSRRLNLPKDKPVWGVFTHLTWDGVFAFEPILFLDPTAWVLETMRMMSKLQDATWVLKVHPAERVHGTARGVQQAISEHFPTLPSHIRVIPADSGLNTYGLLSLLDGGVTIRGTVGLELAMLGKPVILAGQAHYGGKGFTYDSHSRDEYFSHLRQAHSLPPLSQEQKSLARRYAYNFFIERQIPFDLVSRNGSQLAFDSFDDLRQGQNAALDMICDRILNGGEFILDEEDIGL